MKKFILDTNLFFNFQNGLNWGENTQEVIENFNNIMKGLTSKKSVEFYMTPGVVLELLSFFQEKPTYVDNFLSHIIIRSPDVTKITISSSVFEAYVEETRQRSYRGMKVAEEEMDKIAKHMIQKQELSKIAYQKTLGEFVTHFRERYRQATRFNFLDSKTDIDIILLSKEVEGHLVSSDEGVLRWGRMMGVVEVPPHLLRETLESLV